MRYTVELAAGGEDESARSDAISCSDRIESESESESELESEELRKLALLQTL